jgi:hypothetical protein
MISDNNPLYVYIRMRPLPLCYAARGTPPPHEPTAMLIRYRAVDYVQMIAVYGGWLAA